MKNSIPSLLLTGCLLLLPHAARADSTWNASSGNWDQDGNWIGGAPTSADTAIIDSGTALVPTGVNGTYGTLNVGTSGTGTLAVSGGLLDGGTTYIGTTDGVSQYGQGVALVTGGTWNNSGDLTVGYFGGAGSLTISNGSVNVGGASTVGYSFGSGTASISGGTWSSTIQLAVGSYYSTGELNISGSGHVISSAAILGFLNSQGTANISGGTWSNTGGITLGSASIGTTGVGILHLTGGLITETGGGADFLGSDAGSIGVATVSSGTWINDGYMTVASAGSGTLAISGGYVSHGGAIIGGQAGGNGIATVSGGTWNVDGQFVDGYSGTGSLTITGTGVVRIGSGSGTLILGAADDGTGTLNIGNGGAAGTLQASEVSGGYYLTGTGTGFVNFNHTGTVDFTPNISGNIAVTEMGPGTTILSGSNSYTGGTTLQDGTLRIESGDSIGTGLLTINGGTLGNAANNAQTAFENNIVMNSDFSIDASGTDGFVEMFGNVDLGTDPTRTITLTGNGLACFGGEISGQNLTLLSTSGDSMAMFCSITSNVFTGTLEVGSGVTLQLDKLGDAGEPQVIAVAGDAVIDAGGTIDLWISNQFSDTSNVTVNGTLLQSSAETTTINALSGTGSIISQQDGQILKVSSGTFAGTISEDGGTQTVEKQGTGLLVLSGSNSYSGGTIIHSGTLAAAHHNAVGTGQVFVDGGIFLVDAGVSVDNVVKLAGGGYNRTFSGPANLAGAINASSSFSGGRDTTATILAGTLSGASTLQTSFATASSASNDAFRRSDVYSFQGTGTDVFVLQLSLSDTGPGSYLGWLSTSSNLWVNAVDGNTGNNALAEQQGFDGTFAEFQSIYHTDLSDYIGAWGFVTTGGVTSVWAVVDHNSDFAVIPEPSTYALLGLGLLGLGVVIVRSRKAARV